MGKVISLSDFKRKKEVDLDSLCDEINATTNKTKKKKLALEAFKEAERRNKENKERMKKERAKANKKVTRSYRLKK